MSNISVGLYLPCGVNVTPEPIFIEDYRTIQNAVGGHFDAVTTDCNSNGKMLFVGYVHDEGRILDLGYNYLATNLFRRELYGDCVVVWGLDEDGVYDGDNHDIPADVFNTLQEALTESTAQAYNTSLGMSFACQFAIDNGLVNEEMLDMCLNKLMHGALKDPRTDADEIEIAKEYVVGMLDRIVIFTEGNDAESELGVMNEFCSMMAKAFANGNL